MKRYSFPWQWINQYYKLVFAIFLFGGITLRLYGIHYELPYLYHADEGIFVEKAGLILANRDPNPHWFGAPGTTIIYTLCLIFTLIFFVGKGLGRFETPSDFREFFFQDPTVFYLSGRVIFAVCGAASLIMLWKIARSSFNRSTALIGVALFALNPLHIYHSKLIRPDILLTLFMLIAFWFCIDILKGKKWSSYIFAGLFSGLAIATKYPGVVSVLGIAAVFMMNRPWQKSDFLKLLTSGLACGLGTFIASPFLFFDYKTVLSDVAHEARLRHLGSTGEGILQNLAWYVQNPLLGSFTIVGLILAGLGLLLCIKSRQKDKLLLVMFVLIFTVFISGLSLRWDRWIIPTIPFLCILAAYAWNWAIAKVEIRWRLPLTQWVGIGVLFVVVVPLLRADIIQGREMSGKDTRTIAREWILNNIPPGSSLLLEEWASQLPKERYKFFEVRAGKLIRVGNKDIELAAFRPKGRIGALKDIMALRSEKVGYLVLSGWYDRYVAEKNDYADYAEMVAVYEKLMTMGSKMYEVKRIAGVNKGSTIRVYKLPLEG